MKSITDDQNLPKRIKHIANGKTGKRYFERVLGVKGLNLYAALSEDLAFLGILLDQLMQGAMPII